MENLDFLLNQMKQNAKAVDIVEKQMRDTNSFIKEAILGLEGKDKEGAEELQKGIDNIFSKAKLGDTSFSADLEQLKINLSKYGKDGSNSNS